jgi:hypothetical protein
MEFPIPIGDPNGGHVVYHSIVSLFPAVADSVALVPLQIIEGVADILLGLAGIGYTVTVILLHPTDQHPVISFLALK